MEGLFDSALGIAAVLLVIAVLVVIAYELFGPQALGLPAIIGVLALVGVAKLVSDAGLGNVGVVLVLLALVALPLVIGMAMRLGSDPGTHVDDDTRLPEDPRGGA
jgi:hypothetical protein